MRVRRVIGGLIAVVMAVGVAGCAGETAAPAAKTPATKAAAPSAPSTPEATLPAVDRPNILVIETDDMRSDELQWMPNVRKLIGDRGLSFENSFAPYPLCCPSRASFLTGMYAHNHHVFSHVAPYGFHSFDDSRTIATELQGAGYQTALVGKYLNGYGEQPIPGTKKTSLEYVPPGWTHWYAGSDHIWHPGETWKGKRYGGGTYAYYNLTQNIDGKLKNWSGKYSTDVMSGQTRGLVEEFGATGKPWFIWFTPVAPHHGSPREDDDPQPDRRSDGKTTIWQTPARPDWVKGRFDEQITHAPGTPANGPAEADNSDKPKWLRSYPEVTEAERESETVVARQRAESLFALDRQIGKTIATLRKTGQYEKTVVVFTSDNGYYLGEHRKRQGKIEAHEPSLRVPFLIAGPGVPRGVRYDPITSIDLAPTIAAYAGLKGMPGADGIDMTPVITGGDRGWTRPVLTEALIGGYPKKRLGDGFDSELNSRGMRLGRWKLTEYQTGESELYDLKTDPLELQNLSGDPAYAKRLAGLKQVWLSYHACAGEACAEPLPKGLRVEEAESRTITEQMKVRTREYYDN